MSSGLPWIEGVIFYFAVCYRFLNYVIPKSVTVQQGYIAPIAGRGSPIFFYTDDAESLEKIQDIFRLLSAAEKRIDTLRKQTEQIKFDHRVELNKLNTVGETIVADNEMLRQRVERLETVFKDMMRSLLSNISIDILLSKDGDEGQPLRLETVRDHWLNKAGIKLRPGETVDKKKIFVTSETEAHGSF